MEPPDSSFLVTVDDECASSGVDEEGLRATAARALAACDVHAGAHLAITLVDPPRMAELKEQALGFHEETDVLAYPMDGVEASPGPFVLGDIVLCPAVAERQARAAGRTPTEETADLLVHGILHLLGWDHADPDTERSMFAEQARILAQVTMERTT